MRIAEVRQLSNEEMSRAIEEAHKELFNLRFRQSTKKLVNHHEIGRTRKKIARIKTVLRERELATE